MNRPVCSITRHYKLVILNTAKFSKWTDQENKLIRDSILKYGKDWKKIRQLLPHRLHLCIREHVRNCTKVDPYYNSGFWDVDEVRKLIKAIKLYGKRWRKVSNFVETRSPFQCRNYFRDSFTKKDLENYVLNSNSRCISRYEK